MKGKAIRSLSTNAVLLVIIMAVFTLAFGGSVMQVLSPPGITPIVRGNPDKKQVSLMVNVYWGTEFIPGMLEVFKDYGVSTTFFIGGTWAENNGDMLRSIYDAGHELGNHGYFHIDHKKATYAKNYEEIFVAERMIASFTDHKTTLFAPPSGAYSKETLRAADNLGYKVIMWSRDTVDWRDKQRSDVYKRCTKDIKGGELILMHPTAHTLAALPDVLDYYRQNGFLAVTVSKNIAPSET